MTDDSEWDYRFDYHLIWKAHHTWTDNRTDRVDGYLLFYDTKRQLDIASFGDECCVILEKALAKLAWDQGTVFLSTDHEAHGVDTLIVPTSTLTTELIHEALRRFRP